MSSDQYIPRADGKFRTWARNFVVAIESHPPSFMLAPANATDLRKRFDEFATSLQLANNKLTRNVQTIADKDDARHVLEDLCRTYAGLIRANRGISDGDKLLAGVRPVNTSRRQRNCPQISPLLNYVGSTPGVDELQVRDPLFNRFAKPYNVAGIQLWAVYTKPGSKAQPKREDAKFLDTFTSARIYVDRDLATFDWPGTYWARYVGHRHDTGPFSLPASSRIAAQAQHKKQQAKSHQQNDKPDDDEAGDESLKVAA